MSTATPPESSGRLERDHGRIRHPLDRVRKFINTYVTVEALALFGLVITLAFWVGLWSDYGVFRLLTLDWVQAVPLKVYLWPGTAVPLFRFVVLCVFGALLVAFVLFVVLTRFFKEFSDAAVALVLEKRFPRVLGDRLITAVELHNPRQAAKYGYSADLVAETIHEAADRVETVPVAEVFNWRRLISYGLVLLYLTAGLYALTAAGFCAWRAGKGQPVMAGVGDFHEVASIWAERNLLLRNVIWPRQAHLEILPFDPTKKDREPRIARDQPPPPVRVRAWKYVIADTASSEGWRPLTWEDLKDRPALGGANIPALPGGWKPRDAEAGVTVDEVELKLDAFVVRTSPPAGVESLPARYNTANPDGSWRELMWADLTKEKVGGLNVPALPGEWDPKARATLGVSGIGLGSIGGISAASRLVVGPKMISLSVDQVKEAAAAAEKDGKTDKELLAEVRRVIDYLDQLGELRDALDRVETKAADRSMRRTLRQLTIPPQAQLVYRGRRTTNTVTLQRVGDNEFTGNFADLKETVSYYARALDYITAVRRLVVVELPRLDRLDSAEERPAYLYYRSRENTPIELRGKRQAFAPVAVSLSGDATTIEVPAGTHLTLTGLASKPLLKVAITAEAKDKKTLKVGEVDLIDEKRFEVRIPDVRREQRFTFEFEDTDEVKGRRVVVIQPRDDVSPRIREFNPDEVIRKGKEGYIVTANARLPFKARVRDDHGLGKVVYGATVIPADFLNEQKLRSLDGVAGLPLIGRPETKLIGVGYLTALHRILANTAGDDASAEQLIDIPAFAQQLEASRMRDGRPELLEMETVLSLLGVRQKEPFRRLTADFSLTPDKWTDNDDEANEPRRWVRAQDQRAPLGYDLPLWRLQHKGGPLKERDEAKPQKRYIVEVRLLADDNYTEGEIDPKTKQPIPHTSPSSETFTIVVVPENELLSRIAEEEEAKYRELLKLIKPLADNRDRLRDIGYELSSPGVRQEVVNGMIARCDTLDEVLKMAHQDTTAVKNTYERIVREQRLNQVRDDITSKVFRDITLPLVRVADVQFDKTIASVRALRRALDNQEVPLARRAEEARPKASDARNQLNSLVAEINGILNKMQGLAEINALIKELAEIEKQEASLEELLKKIRRKRLDDLLKDPADSK